ncbi:uncharacterized protein CEXT_178351 [Caerostris extrusa]|uniref:Uncharacterized protein n=1 Tax=Caerostris extrusa TaxID=172846 RepID=A0AAV4QM11_CAEEX|nr:uncharacterized protein CEXT_178351 [Caerostris extrusa]
MCASLFSADLLCWPMRSPFASDSESSGGPSPSWERTPGQKRDRSTPASSVPEEDEEPEVDERHERRPPLRRQEPSTEEVLRLRVEQAAAFLLGGSASAANPYAETLKGAMQLPGPAQGGLRAGKKRPVGEV